MVEMRVPLASRRVRYGIVAVVAVLILVLSVVETGTGTTPSGPLGLVGIDKWNHGVAYAALAATLAYASVGSHSNGRVALAVCFAVGFGIGVEVVQWPIPYRTASTADALADAVGACLLALGWRWLDGFARFVRSDERRGSRR